MRPFTALPPKVLASLLAVPALIALVALAAPRWFAAMGLAVVGLTAFGAVLVAIEAGLRRRGRTPGPLAPLPRAAAWAWVVVAATLAWLCAPDLTVKDAGEIGAAAHGLGVPHPTGFPLVCLLGKAATLLPAGAVFFRLNLLSALAMAAGATLAGVVSVLAFRHGRLDGDRPGFAPLLVAPVAFLAAAGPWLHAVTTEVYALAAAGLAATIGAGTMAVARGDVRWLVAGGFLVGLGAGGHVTWPLEGLVFLIPCSLVLARRLGAHVLAVVTLAAATGAMVVTYLPVAAGRDPLVNWGDPSSWDGLAAHLTGERIRRSFAGEMGTLNVAVLAVRVRLLGDVLWTSSGLLWPLALLGAATVVRGLPVVGTGLAAVASCDVAFALLVNPMGLYDLQTSVPLFWVVAVLAGTGTAWLWRRATRARGVLGGVVAAALAFQFAWSPADRDLRDVSVPRRVISGLLGEAPALSSVLTSSDDLSAALIAAQAVEGARPDVLVLVRPHLSDARAVARRVRASRAVTADDDLLRVASAPDYPSDAEVAQVALWPALASRGPLFVETGDGEADRALRSHLVPAFPAYRWVARTPDRARVAEAADVALHRALALRTSGERWGRSFLGTWVRLLGVHLALSGLDRDAIRVTEAALGLDPADARTWHNLGVLHAGAGDLGRAVACLERAVRLDAGYARAWRSLARYAGLAGRLDLETLAKERLRGLARPASP